MSNLQGGLRQHTSISSAQALQVMEGDFVMNASRYILMKNQDTRSDIALLFYHKQNLPQMQEVHRQRTSTNSAYLTSTSAAHRRTGFLN